MGSEDKKKPLIHPAFSLGESLGRSSSSYPGQNDILGETRFVPMDVIETDDSLIVELDLPGVNIAEVSVKVQDDWLLIEGVKREILDTKEKINFLCMERGFGPFKRLLKIPSTVDQDAIQGVYSRGVLVITLPRLIDRRKTTRQIPIKVTKG